MKIDTTEDGTIRPSDGLKARSSIKIKKTVSLSFTLLLVLNLSTDGVILAVCMRDSGYELGMANKSRPHEITWFEAKPKTDGWYIKPLSGG